MSKSFDKVYADANPVRETRWGNMKDSGNRVGLYTDQYETLQEFVNDVWMRYRPFGGKQFFVSQGLVQRGTDLICKNLDSKFYNQLADNRYLTRDRYIKLKQHYKN